jgi:hypothetical protein
VLKHSSLNKRRILGYAAGTQKLFLTLKEHRRKSLNMIMMGTVFSVSLYTE